MAAFVSSGWVTEGEEPHNSHWQNLGQYTVYAGGRLEDSPSDVSGRKVIGGRKVAWGRINGGREEYDDNGNAR